MNEAAIRPTKDLRGHWEGLQERIRSAPALCVLVDFDGTLVALEAHPDLPRLQGETRRVMERLLARGRTTLGVVSGRTLADLIPRIDLPGIWYVGIHGHEVRDPRGAMKRHFEPGDVDYLEGVTAELRRDLQDIPGVLLEKKGPVLAVHHRAVDAPRVSEVEKVFLSVMERHRTRLMISRGHAVLEARPRGGANKGMAVRHIRYELPTDALVLYFGDDLTDHDAFRELQGVGISVEVGGDDRSLADYTLPDPAAVLDVLSRIAERP